MVLLSLLPGLTVSAQEQKTTAPRTVIVVDQAGPVIGASVVIKGTVSGASTDVNGVTTIACPDDAVLSVSYVGYSTQGGSRRFAHDDRSQTRRGRPAAR